MSLFQKSVLNKHLNNLDDTKVAHAYTQFQEIYNLQKIEQIKQLKEEEYQDGFLRDIFVDVLGYVLRPEENHNLQREFKNQSDGKKADGAILKEDKALAIIELKSTITKDLTKVTAQAFNYKNNQPDCKYVITSNFQKLRFYIDYAHEYEEFDLFNLQKDEFKVLYLILHKDNLLTGLPLQIKRETKFHEQDISNKLYKDYSSFKHSLFNNLIKNHPEQDKLILFKKSQKLLDRFLFILFAEDSGLLPPNSISRIIKRFNILKREDAYKPLYDIYQQYFNYMNTGRKGQTPDGDIPAYNGGLFYPDKFLDSLKIDDDALIDDLLNLSGYDFNTEVDVNILGHIFEHSLSEIEEITAQIEGTVADKSKSKRKKDGVFYTPKYITQYIVDNTIGALCNEKRIELNIEEIQFDGTYRKKSGALKESGKQLFKTLNEYKQWLLSLKILDPACGSGAFLNQALNFLIEEHKKIDDILEELTGHSLPLFDTDKSILENNLFGVDINEESVEIAQLSLWLRTAKKDRKLSSLNDNIKCGNSLIDDPEVAGDKAFDWNVEFKDIMDNGGFDVVIGNPPYIKEYTNKRAFDGLRKHKCYQGKMDIWYLFGVLGIELVKINTGLIGYIAPNNWVTNSGASNFRNFVLGKAKIIKFVDFGDFKVFKTAGIQTMIYIMKSTSNTESYELEYSKVLDQKISDEDAQGFLLKNLDSRFVYFKSSIDINNNIGKSIHFVATRKLQVINKIQSKSNFEFESKEIGQGIVGPQDFLNEKNKLILGEDFNVGDGIFVLSDAEFESMNFSENEKQLIKPYFTSTELGRYFGASKNRFWIIYTDSKYKNYELIKPFINIKNHLDRYQSIITSSNKPYGLHRARDEKFFKGAKIHSIRKCSQPTFTYTEFDCYVSQTFYCIKTERINLKFLTGLLNSKLIEFWLRNKGKMQGDLFQIDKEPLMNIPIVIPNQNQEQRIEKLTSQIILNLQKQLSYSKLLKESIIENNFDREILLSQELDNLKEDISTNQKLIDNLVYELYGLSDEEIGIIEQG